MIDHDIPKQGFEIIGDRIISILCKEFSHKASKFKNSACKDVKFFKDRMIAIGQEEGEVINISLWKGEYNNKGRDTVDGYYQFVIDVIASSGEKGDNRADHLANKKLQRLMGIVRYILEHSTYSLLDFDPPFIRTTAVQKFQLLRPEDMTQTDSTVMAQGQMIFMASCREVTIPGEGVPIAGALTDVKVNETDNGFQFEYVA